MADPRLDPDASHPLNAADCERSQARIADIQLGLSTRDPYWRDKALQRVQFLEEDGAVYGLMPHEEAELEQLKSMLVGTNGRLSPLAGGDAQGPAHG